MDVRKYLYQFWNSQAQLERKMMIIWVATAVIMTIITASVYRNFYGQTLVMTLSLTLFAMNSLIFFTATPDSPKIRIAMLMSLAVLDFGCFVYYLFMSAGAAV